MSFETERTNISWARFQEVNPNATKAFEDMCRMLFKEHFFDEATTFHSDSNNPGVEIVPLFCPSLKQTISFQAKFFTGNVDYNKIKESCRKAVEHYAGTLEKIYVYCNKTINSTAKQYVETINLLSQANIKLELITDEEILDRVRNNLIISSCFFCCHNLSDEWYHNKFETIKNDLGRRYSPEFNVSTNYEKYLDLFSCNEKALSYINSNRAKALETINSINSNDKYIIQKTEKLYKLVESCEDISFENKEEYFCTLIETRKSANDVITDLQNKINKLYSDNKKFNTELNSLSSKIEEVKLLFGLDEFDDHLVHNNMLCISGEAGMGKTHFIAKSADDLLNAGHSVIVLLGNTFHSNEPIQIQIMNNLGLDYTFTDLLAVLEGQAQTSNKTSIIFIDAINESANIALWASGITFIKQELNKYSHVKLVFSLRTEFESLIWREPSFDDRISRNEFWKIDYRGFSDNIYIAIKQFLDYYNIAFTPMYYLMSQFSTPLYLKLFCENDASPKSSLFELFDSTIKQANDEALSRLKIPYTTCILEELLLEICYKVMPKSVFIPKSVIFNADFWETNGLSQNKINYISCLETNGILIKSQREDEIVYYFGYNLLEDYMLAKAIMKKCNSKNEIREYIVSELLDIKDGAVHNHYGMEVFIVLCCLYAQKFDAECIDIIDQITDHNEIYIDEYIRSFTYRRPNSIKAHELNRFLSSHKIAKETLWDVLIDCSTNPEHPLNAKYLNSILMPMSINQRDYLWTTYINGLTNEDDRVFQMVNHYEHGNDLDLSDTTLDLLLTFFAWLLTSSNRYLRDKVSKAMIEILKVNFYFCENLLKTFENVNDPYVIQRLYGIVFGACVKRRAENKTVYSSLAHYVYKAIFDKDKVYPDILLRDYARLIIERYRHEYSDDLTFEISKITPPYTSEAIPFVPESEQIDTDGANYNGLGQIASSMMFNFGLGSWYGDFGRYVFQSALYDCKDIDLKNIYRYSMKYIVETLGYTDEKFANYDSYVHYINPTRSETRKCERIGKKYQWITMYNVLARIYDTHKMYKWYGNNLEEYEYAGAWEPFVRDFDPTLNINIMPNSVLLSFPDTNNIQRDLNEFIINYSKGNVEKWLKKKPAIYKNHVNNLLVKDESGTEWVCLYQYSKINNSSDGSFHTDHGSQEIFAMSQSYFVNKSDLNAFKSFLSDKNFIGRRFPEFIRRYCFFNREYYWAPGLLDSIDDQWIDVVDDPTDYFKKYNIPKIGQILPSIVEFMWEAEYDASQENTISFNIPCKEFFNYFKLEPKEYEGVFYEPHGELVAFDGKFTQTADGFMVKKKYLDKFLKEKSYSLFWTCFGEKQFFNNISDSKISEWGGFIYLDGNKINGSIKNKDGVPYLFYDT